MIYPINYNYDSEWLIQEEWNKISITVREAENLIRPIHTSFDHWVNKTFRPGYEMVNHIWGFVFEHQFMMNPIIGFKFVEFDNINIILPYLRMIYTVPIVGGDLIKYERTIDLHSRANMQITHYLQNPCSVPLSSIQESEIKPAKSHYFDLLED